MLVLSRRSGERIVIDDDIVLEVVSIHGNRVKLGIVAPGEVLIRRSELLPKRGDESVPQEEPEEPAA